MQEDCRRIEGAALDLNAGGQVRVVAQWECPDGRAWRVVRWELRGRERALYAWADRGALDLDDSTEEAESWIAGVALEKRDAPATRWSRIRKQELTGTDPAAFAGRLRGWEAGLIDRAERLIHRAQRL